MIPGQETKILGTYGIVKKKFFLIIIIINSGNQKKMGERFKQPLHKI